MSTAWIRRAIARNRRTRPVRFLHRATSLFVEAYQNVGAEAEWDGEFDLIERLAPACLRCVIDVGANTGDWTDRALRSWRDCTVHAFEIAPPTVDALSRRITVGGFDGRVRLNRMGLGATETTQEIHYYPDHPDLTCDRDRFPSYRSEVLTVPVSTGDRYCAAAKLEAIDFLKIDVEGSEMQVLHGFAGALEAGAVRIIQFEYGAFSVDTRVLLQDYYRLLEPRYLIGKIYPGFVDFKPYEWRDESFQFANYVCVDRREPRLVALAAG